MEDNLVSKCWVIEDSQFGVQPVIYLTEPNARLKHLFEIDFETVFEAKQFINKYSRFIGKVLVKKSFSEQFSENSMKTLREICNLKLV